MLEFRLLGPIEVVRDGATVALGGRRERTMLAMLVLADQRVVPVDRIIDVVWGDGPPPTARRQVHTGMSALRRVVGELLHTRQPGYALLTNPGQVDIHDFDTLLAKAKSAAAEDRLADAAVDIASALRLWRGPALGGSTGLGGEVARLEERRITALEEQIAIDLSRGRHADLVADLSALVVEHPTRQRLHGQLMLALYRAGRSVEALQAYRAAHEALTTGFGLESPSALGQLQRAILADDPRLQRPVEWPFRLTAPALLPPDLADFTGRDELATRVRLALTAIHLTAPPVCAIAGRGGVGKTALAVHVAHSLTSVFRDGQLYVNLHGVQDQPADPIEVLARFLRALGVDGTAIPDGLEERAEMYLDRVAGRRVLILLDDARDEAQVTALLPAHPGCGVLVTSRTRLGGLPGVVSVDLDEFDPDEAVRLLTRIAGPRRIPASSRGARQVVDLCGHLPLAVRIAGARLASRPHWRLAELVARLGDERYRLDELVHGRLDVRASLGLSYRGLDPGARRLLRLLGLLEAPEFAAWVAAALLDTTPAAAETAIDTLVRSRLLDVARPGADEPTRYSLHDLVRVFARERAHAEESASEQTAALARAFGAWLALAEHAHRGVYGGDYLVVHGPVRRWRLPADLAGRLVADPLTWLETERLALTAAVRQAAETNLSGLAWDLVQSSLALFGVRWYLDDWQRANAHALAASRRTGDRLGQAATLYSVGAWHDAHGRYESAASSYDAAGILFAEVADRHGHGLVLAHGSHIARRLGRLSLSLTLGERALVLLRDVDDPAATAAALRSLARTHLELDHHDIAERYLGEALAAVRGRMDTRDEAQILREFGELHLRRGTPDQAERSYRDALHLVHGLRDRVGEAYVLHGLGVCLLRQGHYRRAETTLTGALGICDEAGLRFLAARVLLTRGELRRATGDTLSAVALLRRSADLCARLKAPLWQARALRALGDTYHAVGRDADAALPWQQAGTLLAGLAVD